jgi:hypothetical protein
MRAASHSRQRTELASSRSKIFDGWSGGMLAPRMLRASRTCWPIHDRRILIAPDDLARRHRHRPEPRRTTTIADAAA